MFARLLACSFAAFPRPSPPGYAGYAARDGADRRCAPRPGRRAGAALPGEGWPRVESKSKTLPARRAGSRDGTAPPPPPGRSRLPWVPRARRTGCRPRASALTPAEGDAPHAPLPPEEGGKRGGWRKGGARSPFRNRWRTRAEARWPGTGARLPRCCPGPPKAARGGDSGNCRQAGGGGERRAVPGCAAVAGAGLRSGVCR